MRSRDISVRDMLHRAAAWSPERESVVDELYRYTYPTLLDQVQRCAGLYHKLGVRKGDRVALMTVSSVQHAVALFAAIELGAIPVALHVRESVGNLSAVLESLSPRVLAYDGAFAPIAGELKLRNPLITGWVRTISAMTPDEEREAGDDPVIPRD
ncbi:MAG: class I adenylate-forming enzyme family protein, partial [Gammaproteobacteria bacterium]